MIEWVSGWASEWGYARQFVGQKEYIARIMNSIECSMCEWKHEWKSGWVTKWMIEWVSGWASEWGYARQFVGQKE